MNYENQQLGGLTATQKIYYCPTCNGLGKNQRFVHHHLANECDGKQKRKTAACTKENQHRLEEATMNTKYWKSEKLMKESYKLYKQFQTDALRDIDNMRNISNEAVEDMIKTYYTQLF